MKVFLSEGAKADLTEIASWYESQRAELGTQFKEELLACMDRLARYPRMYVEVDEDVRRARVRNFPYSVYYTVESTGIEILAIHQDNREPGSWEVHDVDHSWMPRPEMQIAS